MADPGVRRPRTLFLGSGYAGHRVRFEGLQRHTKADPRHAPRYRIVSGWQAGGSLERLPLPPGLSGRIRALQEASILTRPPRPDAIWLSASHLAAPFLWWNTGRWRRPMVVDLDWTREQQELMAPDYFGRPARIGARRALGDALERWLWSGAAYFTPWSHWAADSLQRQGVRPDRIRVMPPGVDLDAWRPPAPGSRGLTERLQLLFVGNDFERKGGSLLVEAMASGLAGVADLHVVTGADVRSTPGVTVHRATPNSPQLRALFERAELFVMPSKAECFGLAILEAMATGLPAVVGLSGAMPEIVEHGRTGWLVEPSVASITSTLRQAWERREALPAMGAAARCAAEARFDGRRNDARVLDLLLEAAHAG